jgi:phospholipid/cholesterol/gamma-HCH transport system substrate-binding protein
LLENSSTASAPGRFSATLTEMVKETYALLTGLFVLTLGTAMVVMGLFLGDYGRERDVYILWTQGAVSGLNPESEVIYRGVKAGKVVSIGFDPKDTRNIFVHIELDKGLPITRGTFATLRVQPLTGLAQVELSDAGDNLEPLKTDPHNPAHIPIQPSLLDKLTGSSSDILTQVTQLTHRLNSLLGDENQGRIEHSLEMLDRAVTEMVALERRVVKELDRVPALDKRLRSALEDHSAAARSVRETSERIGQLTAHAAELVAQGKSAATTLNSDQLPQLRTLLDDLRQAAANFRKLSSTLQRDPQVLLLGPSLSPPGPGEPGYQEPR